jgi:hypothetical protein
MSRWSPVAAALAFIGDHTEAVVRMATAMAWWACLAMGMVIMAATGMVITAAIAMVGGYRYGGAYRYGRGGGGYHYHYHY